DDVQINSVDQTAINMDKNSVVELNDNVAITRSDGNDEIFVDPTSALRINGSDITLANVGCEGITSYVQDGSNNSVNISNICNGYQNLTPNFVKITSGNCESNGYNNLTSPHECSQAIGSIVRAIHDGADTYGCAEGTDNTFNSQQTSWRVEDKSWVNAMWCKE
ncbi:MAG: hypothetical protein VX208_14560, partial [SAR324 cluster bacterium]|nr:hypothetical protein [SAR324 cluster bacterium]